MLKVGDEVRIRRKKTCFANIVTIVKKMSVCYPKFQM